MASCFTASAPGRRVPSPARCQPTPATLPTSMPWERRWFFIRSSATGLRFTSRTTSVHVLKYDLKKESPMRATVQIEQLSVDRVLHDFVNLEALPGTRIDARRFWHGFAGLVRTLAPRN